MTETTIAKTAVITDTALNKLINEHISNLPKIGDIVKGQVISASRKEILIDISGFTTGIIRGREIRNLPLEYSSLNAGDEIEAMIIDIENEKGQIELSLHAALTENAWHHIKEKEKTQETLPAKITGANKGGLLTVIRGIQAFLPVSQLTNEHYPRVDGGDKKKILKKLRNFIGKTIPVKIISFSVEEEKIIISEKRAWEELQKQKLKQYKTDDILPVSVKAITNFGVFVNFGDNLEGLIHVSEIPETFKHLVSQTETTPENASPEKKVPPLLQARIINIRGTKVFFSLTNLDNE